MKTIHKYPVHSHIFDVVLPIGASFLSVQSQNNSPQMWWMVDEDVPTEVVTLYRVATGSMVPPNAKEYLGTYQINNGQLVYHVFRG